MSVIKKPSELKPQTSIKALIYGQPGLRKTTLSLSSPAPLLLDFDHGVHRVDPRHHVDTVPVEKWEDVIELLKEDLSSYRTLVIDTAGKMLDYMSAYVIKQNPKNGKADGTLQLQGYGARKTLFISFLRQASMLGKHLVFVAHEKEEKDGEVKIVRPEIGGSSAGDLIKELDLVGYMQSVGNKKQISFEPCEKFYAKNSCQLEASIELHNTIEDHLPNNQLAGIFEKFEAAQKDRVRIAGDYNELLDIIDEKVQAIKDAESANEVLAWAGTYEDWIWDAKLRASKLIRDRANQLSLTINKTTKKYEAAKDNKAAKSAEAQPEPAEA